LIFVFAHTRVQADMAMRERGVTRREWKLVQDVTDVAARGPMEDDEVVVLDGWLDRPYTEASRLMDAYGYLRYKGLVD